MESMRERLLEPKEVSMKIRLLYLENKGANGNLAMKGISRVFVHQKLQYLCAKE